MPVPLIKEHFIIGRCKTCSIHATKWLEYIVRRLPPENEIEKLLSGNWHPKAVIAIFNKFPQDINR